MKRKKYFFRSLITNLPKDACVEVPCWVDRNGITPTCVGDLPLQLAAMNSSNNYSQPLTIEAAHMGKHKLIYQAALMELHTAAELSADEIVALCTPHRSPHRSGLSDPLTEKRSELLERIPIGIKKDIPMPSRQRDVLFCFCFSFASGAVCLTRRFAPLICRASSVKVFFRGGVLILLAEFGRLVAYRKRERKRFVHGKYHGKR